MAALGFLLAAVVEGREVEMGGGVEDEILRLSDGGEEADGSMAVSERVDNAGEAATISRPVEGDTAVSA